MKTYHISHNGREWNADLVKSATLHDGTQVYLFKLDVKIHKFMDQYAVAAKRNSETLLFYTIHTLNRAISIYLDTLCLFA